MKRFILIAAVLLIGTVSTFAETAREGPTIEKEMFNDVKLTAQDLILNGWELVSVETQTIPEGTFLITKYKNPSLDLMCLSNVISDYSQEGFLIFRDQMYDLNRCKPYLYKETLKDTANKQIVLFGSSGGEPVNQTRA